MEPNFTKLDIKRGEGQEVPEGHVFDPKKADPMWFSLKVDWKENGKATATSVILTAPDKSIWKITAVPVEQTAESEEGQ